MRTCNGLSPDVALIDFQDADRATAISEALASNAPATPRVGIMAPDWRREPDWGEIQTWIPARFSMREFDEACLRAIRKRDEVTRARIQSKVFLFMPSKAGSGATTVALHSAAALANHLRSRTLFLDADLRSGVSAMMLNLNPPQGLRSLLERASRIDAITWQGLISKYGELDLICAKPDEDGPMPQWSDYYHLLEYARRQYSTVIFDLPELINNATIEAARAAERIFLVTTAEVISLKLAGQRLSEFARRGISSSQIGVVVNRYHKGELTTDQIGGLLGVEVAATVPNDYRAIQSAIYDGMLAPAKSPVGKAAIEIARSLAIRPDTQKSTGQSLWQKLVG
ncbi:MAG: hypothetical protein FJW39_29430 [Acidobacteria bacterium]|nr:hypothetical protein [Acidobacteriota bacterium]